MKNQIKTFEEACKELGLDAEKIIPTFEHYPEKHRKAMIAHAKLPIIIEAANKIENDGKEWIPDFTNFNERKYEPWFDLEENGSSGFRYYVCDGWITRTGVGSRLCFISRELCEYISNQFIDLYEDYIAR